MKPTNRLFYLVLALFVLAYLPWLLLGPDSYVVIHDNLDSEWVYLELLNKSGLWFDYSEEAIIPHVMNGLPRIALRSGLSITVLLYTLFPSAYAYILNHLLVHLIGFVGMYLLLRRYVAGKDSFIPLVVGLLFGLVSYYHSQYGISISGQPLLLYVFLNILHGRDRWHDWLYLCFFPFYSFLVVTLPFFLPLLIILWLWWAKQKGQYQWRFVLAILLLAGINMLVEYPILKGVLGGSGFVSHREDYDFAQYIGPFSLKTSLNSLIHGLLFTQYHAGRFFTLPILLLMVFVWIKARTIARYEVMVLVLIVLIGLWASFNDWFIIRYQHDFRWIKIITLDRFFFLSPFLWMILLALVLKRVDWKSLFYRWLSYGSVGLLLVGVLYFNTEFLFNLKLLLGSKIKEPSFRQFYDPGLFAEIKEHIGRSRPAAEYRVVSLGLHPSVAQFNGLFTLDSYQNNYPLAYKYQFREIIAPELEKAQALKDYFDGWGSRAYVFSAELGKTFLYGKQSARQLTNLALNYEALKKMGGVYIISAVPIADRQAPLILEKTFENRHSFWKLYLYRVN